MKQLFIFCLSALFFAGIGNAQTVITGQILKPANNNKLVYSTTGYTGFKDTLQTDDKGFFELKLTVAKSAFVSLRTTEPYKLVKLLVEPNGKYHVIFDEKKVVQITGTNEKGQALYARFPNPEFIQEEISAYKKDTTIAQIRRKIAQSKQSDIENLQKLYNKKEISPAFFKLAKVDRDCYYASLETFILLSIKSMRFNNLLKDDGNISKYLGQIYTRYSPNQEEMMSSTFWNEYAQRYIMNLFTDEFLQKMTEMTEKGLGRTLMIDDSKKYFTGNVFEYFWAFFMHDQLFALGTRDEEVITLFEQFQKEYPNSQYSKYIKPYVDNVVKYHQIIKNPFGEEIKFLENYENVNTLEDAIKTLKGKAIYVDVWASWCGPCKAEFAHNAELKKVLDEKDISILYISIDDDTRNAQWLNDIKYYNLAGTHIRVNKLFDSDLRRLFDKNGGLAIPWYILIDKDGNILDLDAGSPSQLVPGKKIISVNKL